MSRPLSRPVRRTLVLAVTLPATLVAATLAACGPAPTEVLTPRHHTPAIRDGAPRDTSGRSGGSSNPNI